jgi:hypothetical protein
MDIFNEMMKKASYGKGVLKPCIDEIEALRQQLDAANTLIKNTARKCRRSSLTVGLRTSGL